MGLSEFGNEIGRTENGKIYELDPGLGMGTFGIEARSGPIHYKNAYLDSDSWLDLDIGYTEDMGTYLLYPKMPNIVKIYKNLACYEIQNRHNPNHLIRVELVSVNGFNIDNWLDNNDVSIYAKVHFRRVGIWKKFKKTHKEYSVRWKITEIGRDENELHLMNFKDVIEAWTIVDPNSVPEPMDYLINVPGTRTDIDATSWYWDELIPKGAMLVDTDFRSSANSDDGYMYGVSSFTATTYYIRVGMLSTYENRLFVRFPSITIPAGSTINTAKVTYSAYADATSTTVNTDLAFNAEDNPSAPTSRSALTGLTLTSVVAWDSIGSWTAGQYYDTPSIVTPVQAVIDRSGWVSGNALLFVHKDGGSTNGAYRTVDSIDGPYDSPVLWITWTPPPTSIKTVQGLAKSSVKTIHGTAIASVKTLQGLV